MWSIHPDALQDALTPISGNCVIRFGIVPVDSRGTAIQNCNECQASGEQRFARRFRSEKRCLGWEGVHKSSVFLHVVVWVCPGSFTVVRAISRRGRDNAPIWSDERPVCGDEV